ncbi:glycerophosphodiester phosphodiesterase family protein [Hymenobacter metallilatus]|uniref:Glycerophosphodiester phosphodiesterase n=1 Tax=Hymenobacter metallilatus TaxID=2493666 RepID=A0A3R9MPT1_9BACT|nr:glycerophosphodiester phosphodiesterase family protein [Hymenobacter metallilatus]RSK37646.1 glycerophosphodiester phosphodiesterase [Hymenobacter metallilatus]
MILTSPAGSYFPEIHGHRGCRGLAPENTLPAFRRALHLGVDVLELDVVISADNQVVVSHEPWMSAAFCLAPNGTPISPDQQRQHNLYALPYATIRQYDCGSRPNRLFPDQQSESAPKPLLRDVVAFADALAQELGKPPVRFSIEIKSSPAGDGIWHPAPASFLNLVLEQFRLLGLGQRATLLCFDKRILRLARSVAPDLPLCLLVEDERPLHVHLQELGFLPHIYGPDFRLLSSAMVEELLQLQIGLVPWTVNELADLRHVLSFKPHGITTDYPNRLIQLLS